jgi:cell division initiation protein
MDVTPQVINEVEFHQKMRGYDPDEVDDFLERVAVAVEQLQERVRQAEQRAAAAEQRAAEGPSRTNEAPSIAASPAAPRNKGDDTEAIRRTLVLAQRTADAAVKEAEDEAKRTLQSAQEQVQRLYAEAQDRARKIVTDAEAEGRKGTEDTRKRLVKEIMTLEETRDALRADQGILERHLDEQRLRLRSSIGALQRVLDDPGRLRASTPPELSGASLPGSPKDTRGATRTTSSADTATTAEVEPDAEVAPEPAESENPFAPPITGSITFTPPDDDAPIAADAAARSGGDTGNGPPRRATPVRESTGDAYLNSLREAMLEDTSASTLDPGEHRARARFGRRR